MPLYFWLVLGFIIAALLYWLLITTEGVFLGRRAVVWLYDMTAHRYEAIKAFDIQDEHYLVARPVLMALVDADESPIILDVATGSGRVPAAMLRLPDFDGYFVCLDASARMLEQAASKLAAYHGRFELHRGLAVPLPFPDRSFDLVTCLEALEFLPDDRAALQEMIRVMRPGSRLITTRRRGLEGKAFLHRYRSRIQFEQLLCDLGLVDIQTMHWQVSYNLVIATRPEID